MTPDEYEQVTRSVVESIYEQVEGLRARQAKQGRTNLWRGMSGFRHQIDVSVEGNEDLLLIECKMWSDSVDVPRFLTFLARILDITPTEHHRKIHAAVVTTKGFESGVNQLADCYKIDLQRVSSPVEFAIKYKHLFAIGVQDDLNRWSDIVETEPK